MRNKHHITVTTAHDDTPFAFSVSGLLLCDFSHFSYKITPIVLAKLFLADPPVSTPK